MPAGPHVELPVAGVGRPEVVGGDGGLCKCDEVGGARVACGKVGPGTRLAGVDVCVSAEDDEGVWGDAGEGTDVPWKVLCISVG